MKLRILAPLALTFSLVWSQASFSASAYIDPITGIEWMEVSETAGRTYEDINSQFGASGEFEGWRYAKGSELINLLENIGSPRFPPSYINSSGPVYEIPRPNSLFKETFNISLHDYEIGAILKEEIILSQEAIDKGITIVYDGAEFDTYSVFGPRGTVKIDVLKDEYFAGSLTLEEISGIGYIWDEEYYHGTVGILIDDLSPSLTLSEIALLYASAGGYGASAVTYFGSSEFGRSINGRAIGGIGTGHYLVRGGVSAVPVPAALFMFAPALLGFIGFRRRVKNSAF